MLFYNIGYAHIKIIKDLLTYLLFMVQIRGMSLEFVDNLSIAQLKQRLVSSSISSYSVIYQEYMCEK